MPIARYATGTFAPTTTADATIHTFVAAGVYVLNVDLAQMDSTDVLRVDFVRATGITQRDTFTNAQTPEVAQDLGPYVITAEEAAGSSCSLHMAQSTGGDGADDFAWSLLRIHD